MKRLTSFLKKITEIGIHCHFTRWFRVAFETNWYSPEYAFYCTYFGVGLTIPFVDFCFRVLQDSHRESKFKPIVSGHLELWKLAIRVQHWTTVEETKPADWEAGIYFPEETVRCRAGLHFMWDKKTIGEWIPRKTRQELKKGRM